MNISEGLGWAKTLKERHAELVALRNANSSTRVTRYGNSDPVELRPEYDVKALDKRITLLARESRLLDEAIKRTNAATQLEGFQRNDEVLGELD